MEISLLVAHAVFLLERGQTNGHADKRTNEVAGAYECPKSTYLYVDKYYLWTELQYNPPGI